MYYAVTLPSMSTALLVTCYVKENVLLIHLIVSQIGNKISVRHVLQHLLNTALQNATWITALAISLYFQCQSGGCLHTARLCDGQDDCLYGEDEAICDEIKDRQAGHISLGHLNNNGLPRGGKFLLNRNFSDEMYLLNGHSKVFYDFCIPAAELPCMEGYLKCYPVDKQCIYDRTPESLLKYCANGGHLKGCTSQSDVQCSGTFKCYQSYCIPVHLLCDGILDCPYGDDERQCPIEYCHHMLHCGSMCVHPNEICDGIKQCANGEDEMQCGAPTCPESCECLGYSVLCQDAESILFTPPSLGLIKKLTIKHSWQGYSLKHLSSLSSLLILDLSHSKKQTTVGGELVAFGHMCVLLLRNNSLDNIVDGFFQNAVNLRELDLSWNPITHFNEFSIMGLHFLRYLNLSHCYLKTISLHAFSDIVIQSLDLSKNQLAVLDVYCIHGNTQHIQLLIVSGNIIESMSHFNKDCVKAVISAQVGFCCLEKVKEYCVSNVDETECSTLMSSPLFWYSCSVTVLIVISNIGAILYNLHLSDPQATLSAMLATVSLVMAIPMYSLIRWHFKYGTEFAYYEYFLPNDLHCKLTYSTLFLSTEISVSIWLLISGYKWYGIAKIKIKISSDVKMCARICPVVVCLLWFSVIFPFVSRTEGSPPDIYECIFGGMGTTLLLLFGVTNIISCLFILGFYGAVLGVVRDSTKLVAGKKHVYDTFKVLSARVWATMMVSVFCILAPSITMICVSLWGASVQYISAMQVVFPLQALLYPFLHTFSMPKFIRKVRNIRECSFWNMGSKL